MTFTDFDRLLYITDLIGFSELNLEIWETYSGHFQKQFQEFERWVQDSTDDMVFNLTERENDMSEKSELNLEIWETYSGHFQKQFQEFERWVQDSTDDMVFNLTERENDMSEKWVEDFLGQIPDRKSEKIVKRWMQGKNA